MLFFIILAPSQQPQDQLQPQHSVHIGNYIMDKHNNKLQANTGERKHINIEKENKQKQMIILNWTGCEVTWTSRCEFYNSNTQILSPELINMNMD